MHLAQQGTLKIKDQQILQNIQLMVPYSGKQGYQLVSKMKKQLTRTLPEYIKTMITLKSTKLSTRFSVKDLTDFKHKNNIVYHSSCPSKECKDNYVGEIDVL